MISTKCIGDGRNCTQIKSPETIKALELSASSKTEMLKIRLKAITALGKIGTDEAVSSLTSILNEFHAPCIHRLIVTLGKLRSPKALKSFLNILEKYERKKIAWREFRDTWRESFTEEQKEAWQIKFQELKPAQYLEFELGHAISRIDASEGIKLLAHDIASVRKGASTGLGEIGTASLVKEICETRNRELQTGKRPWFSDAAYRAIDKALIQIEHFGTKDDLDKLAAFMPEIGNRDTDAVYTRVEWTVDRLKERFGP